MSFKIFAKIVYKYKTYNVIDLRREEISDGQRRKN